RRLAFGQWRQRGDRPRSADAQRPEGVDPAVIAGPERHGPGTGHGAGERCGEDDEEQRSAHAAASVLPPSAWPPTLPTKALTSRSAGAIKRSGRAKLPISVSWLARG